MSKAGEEYAGSRLNVEFLAIFMLLNVRSKSSPFPFSLGNSAKDQSEEENRARGIRSLPGARVVSNGAPTSSASGRSWGIPSDHVIDKGHLDGVYVFGQSL